MPVCYVCILHTHARLHITKPCTQTHMYVWAYRAHNTLTRAHIRLHFEFVMTPLPSLWFCYFFFIVLGMFSSQQWRSLDSYLTLHTYKLNSTYVTSRVLSFDFLFHSFMHTRTVHIHALTLTLAQALITHMFSYVKTSHFDSHFDYLFLYLFTIAAKTFLDSWASLWTAPSSFVICALWAAWRLCIASLPISGWSSSSLLRMIPRSRSVSG